MGYMNTWSYCTLEPIVCTITAPTYALDKFLAGLLNPWVGGCENHVRNSAIFAKIVEGLRIVPTDVLVSFDVVSLFMGVPVEVSLKLLQSLFTSSVVELFQLVLQSTYFLYWGKYYEQTNRVVRGSLLSLVMANFYMEVFEHLVFQCAPLKPSYL